MKKFLLILFIFILTSCTPTYRILTVDHNYTPKEYHVYEIVNLDTGEIDTVYDFTYYKPGMYVDLKEDNRVPGKLIIKSVIE